MAGVCVCICGIPEDLDFFPVTPLDLLGALEKRNSCMSE